MYQYISGSTSIKRLSDGAYIPSDTRNADYQAYRAWLAAGNTPQTADPPPPSPAFQSVDFATGSTMPDQVVGVITSLRTYLNTPTPTAAESTAALKLLIRVVLFLAQRLQPYLN